MNSNAISPMGFFSLLFISRTLSSVMYVVPTENTSFSDTDLILRSISGMLITLLTALPVYWYVKRFQNRSIVDAMMAVSPVLGKAIAAGYWLSNVYIALRIVARYDLFASSVMFPETDMSFFVLILVIAGAYVSTLGLRALGRSSLIFLMVFLSVIALTLAAVIPEIDFLNLTPLFNDGVAAFIKDSVVSSAYTVDLALIPFFLSRIKGKTEKPFFIWLISTSFFISFVSLFLVTTLGKYAGIQLFPSFSIASLGKIGTFERLDSLETSLWLGGMLLKLSFLLYICTDAFNMLFPKAQRVTGTIFSTAFIAIASVFISQQTSRFSFIFSSGQFILLYAIMVIVVPLTAITAESLKKRGKQREAVN